jgi:intracellular multiplication protein IcmG
MSDPKDENERIATEEGLESFGSGENVWHEDQPPVDGFEDHDIEGETGEAVVEEAEPDEEVEEVSQKKGAWLPLAAAVFGILFVGTMIYLQYGSLLKGSSAPQPILETMATTPSTPAIETPAPAPDTTVASAPAAAPAGTNIGTAIPESGNIGTVSPIDEIKPAPTAIPAANVPVPEVAPVGAPPVSTAEISAKPASPAPALEVPAKAPVAAAMPSAAVAPVASLPLSTDVGSKEIAARLDAIQKTLEQTSQRLGAVESTVANLQAAGVQSGASSDVTSLQNRISKIEQNLASGTSLAATSELKAEPVSSVEPKQAKVKAKEAKPVKEVSKKKEVKSHKAAKLVEPKGKTSWVLRAAAADSAWVSKSADSAELRQVEVGQSVPGIGKVKAIREVGGKWEIVGSNGIIR